MVLRDVIPLLLLPYFSTFSPLERRLQIPQRAGAFPALSQEGKSMRNTLKRLSFASLFGAALLFGLSTDASAQRNRKGDRGNDRTETQDSQPAVRPQRERARPERSDDGQVQAQK